MLLLCLFLCLLKSQVSLIGTSLPSCHPSVLKRVCSPPLVAWKCIESSDQDFFGYRDKRQKDLSLLEVLKVFVILLVPISKDLFILTFMLVYYNFIRPRHSSRPDLVCRFWKLFLQEAFERGLYRFLLICKKRSKGAWAFD